MQVKSSHKVLDKFSQRSQAQTKRVRTEISTNRINYPHSTFVEGDIIKKRFNALLKELHTLLCKLYEGKLVFNYGEKVTKSVPADLIRVLSEWSQNDFVDLTLRNIIVDSIVSSENKQTGSGIICALALLNNLDNLDSSVTKYRTRAVTGDLKETIKYHLGQGNLSRVTKHAIEMGALNGSLRFEISNTKDFFISSETSVKIVGSVHPMFELTKRWFDFPTMVCVDGLIQSLGELDRILQGSAENKNNVIILARDYHPDVINTLNENFKEGRLNVIPFAVRAWSDDLTKEPLQACDELNLEIISRDRGDVLAAKGLDDFSVVKSVYLSARNISIHDRDGSDVHTTIRIPNVSESLAGLIEDRVRITLQSCKGIAKWGLLKNHEILEFADSIGFVVPKISVNSIVYGIKTAQQCKVNISNMGAIITPDIE